jgi:YfiH family protein
LYSFRASHGSVDLAFTDRLGGVSAPPYDELNLALESLDDPGAVAENWRLLLDDFAPGADLADLHQVHGATVVAAAGSPGDDRAQADGIITGSRDLVLAVRAADCVPVLLADPDAGRIGALHCGRPGLAAGIVPRTVEVMRNQGAQRIEAWIGPHVCGGCYEVPAEMQEEVAAVVPESRATTTWGTPSLDLGAGVRAQLAAEGVPVNDVSRCTRESRDLFSYRRDGADAGRLAGLVVMR